jgi:energy-coupling factor transporter ATP-binding protein EcfA2
MSSLFARFLGSSVAAAAALRAFPFSSSSDDVANARKEAELAELRARLRKADAEADEAANRADKVKAEADEAANRADKVKAETAEATARAAKVKAETGEATARAAMITSETDASAKTANDLLWARRTVAGVLIGAVVLGGSFLAYDHYTHHNRAYLRRRIRQTLLAGPNDGLLPLPPRISPLPLPPFPIVNMNRPVLVLGASGSGKSTQMGDLARTLKQQGVPVVYFRFRTSRQVATREWAARGLEPEQLPRREDGSKAPSLTVAAQRFYQAVGYPEQSSYLSRWQMKGFKLSWEGPELNASPDAVANRFTDAITDLFAVCGELYMEREADPTVSPADRAPVVLSDELHDLLHDRFHSEGGKVVFAHFGNEMTHSCADSHMSRVVLAASVAGLLKELEDLSAAGGDRVFSYTQPDPPESVVRERLAALGYDQASMDAIVATCGTRVRLLYPFLESRLMDIHTVLKPLQTAADDKVVALMARCPEKSERKRLVKLLDTLAETPTSTVLIERFPEVVQRPFPNKVLLRQLGGKASFQTEAVRQAWLRNRRMFA